MITEGAVGIIPYKYAKSDNTSLYDVTLLCVRLMGSPAPIEPIGGIKESLPMANMKPREKIGTKKLLEEGTERRKIFKLEELNLIFLIVY